MFNTCAQSSASNPLELQDFGTNGVADLAIPWSGSEHGDFENDVRNIIWPWGKHPNICPVTALLISVGGMATLGDGSAAFMTGVGTATTGAVFKTIYSTLVTVTANATGPTFTRAVPQLFTEGAEPLWGTFGLMMGHSDGYLYLFMNTGGSDGYLGMARVLPATLTDKSTVSNLVLRLFVTNGRVVLLLGWDYVG